MHEVEHNEKVGCFPINDVVLTNAHIEQAWSAFRISKEDIARSTARQFSRGEACATVD